MRTAIEKTRNDVSRIQVAAAREIDEEHALIFASHLLLLNDPALLERVDQEIGRGVSAPLAIDAAFEEFEARLRLVPDAYIRERIDDVDDLRSRLLDHVLDAGGRARFGAGVVLTSRIPPSLVVELKTEGAQALVTETGGETSHGVLLARAMGIPVVTGIADAPVGAAGRPPHRRRHERRGRRAPRREHAASDTRASAGASSARAPSTRSSATSSPAPRMARA